MGIFQLPKFLLTVIRLSLLAMSWAVVGCNNQELFNSIQKAYSTSETQHIWTQSRSQSLDPFGQRLDPRRCHGVGKTEDRTLVGSLRNEDDEGYEDSIDLLQKWLPLNYSFVHIQNSPTNLAFETKILKNLLS